MIERGQLSFGDALGRQLNIELHGIEPGVTVEHLLTHISGVPGYFGESSTSDYEALWGDFPNYRIRTNADLLPLFINKPMMYPRGEKFQYNNTGYVCLR